MADGLIFHYTKAQYNAKINKLQGLSARLLASYNRLVELRNQVNKFWNDPQAPEYLANLDKQIRAVRVAREQTDRQLSSLGYIIDRSVDMVNMSARQISEIAAAINGLGLGDIGSAASSAPASASSPNTTSSVPSNLGIN